MNLKPRWEQRDGYVVHRVYSCPCGKGVIEEEQDYTPGHRSAFAVLKCSTCQKHYHIDFGQSETKWRLYHDYTTYYKDKKEQTGGTVMATNNRFITSADSLVTTHEETRAGFLAIALEKNRVGDPFVKNALAFKAMVSHTRSAEDLLTIPQVRPFLITAAGLSDKSLAYLNEDDQTMAIQELIEKFLKPAGDAYIDEATFRYLLIKGDAVGGTMRNKIGALGQEKLIRAIFSSMNVRGISCEKLSTESKRWSTVHADEAGVEANVKALHWSNTSGSRLLVFNAKVPTVNKNVDICLFSGNIRDYDDGRIVRRNERALMFGELKGGIDPAGADEHWKTGNSALNRIRTSFRDAGYPTMKTSFIGAAIERSMAEEIFDQLRTGTLTNATNLTNINQLIEYCNWLIEL